MPVPTSLTDLSTTPGSNSPASTDTLSNADDYLRAQASIIKRVTTGVDAMTSPDINGGTIDGTTQASGTINGPIAAGGTWTAAATWTLPAHVLAGNVTSTGNPSLNLGTGALTAGATSLTGTANTKVLTVSASSGDQLYVKPQAAASGIEVFSRNSADSAYAPLSILADTITARGASVYGTFSSTGLSLGSLGLTAGAGTFSGDITLTGSASTIYGGSSANSNALSNNNGSAYFQAYGSTNAGQASQAWVIANGAAVGKFSSTGLSLGSLGLTAGSGTLNTGALTFTGSATGGSDTAVWVGPAGDGGLFLNVPTGEKVYLGVGNANYANVSSTGLEVSGIVTPDADNTRTLGTGALRWSVVYAGTGTINTSDAREKTSVSGLTADEINAAKQLSKEVGSYKWLASVASKGDAARKHIGLTVQRAIEIMEANSLAPFDYGFICYDKWDDKFIEHPAVEAVEAKDAVLDEDGNVMEPAVEAVAAKAAWSEQTQIAGDRYAFRYDELNLFIAAGLEARLAALEAA